ncbi:Uncharacterised protein [Halioglobus japonicus]|nr:Uncharacterised protein [Halioglobus japonicus]
MSQLTTIYPITDEYLSRSSISLFKLDADVLQYQCGNVHTLVQKTFDSVTANNPTLIRRKRGDLVRLQLSSEAKASPVYRQMLNRFI